MAIIFLYGEDEKYYKKDGVELIKKTYPEISELNKIVNYKELEKTIEDAILQGENKYILTPIYHSEIIKNYSSFIKVIRLPNEKGILTSQDIKLKITEEEKLKNLLDCVVTKPKLTFDDYGGAESLREDTKDINLKFKLGIPVNGVFLVGIPGTGKSYFAKCLAGELNRYLIELNLSKIIKDPKGIILLEEFFDFFKTSKGDYIIWIDEIEKMIGESEESTQILGALLTKVNEFNTVLKKSTAFIVATANNISKLAKSNPELFRNGRFDLLISLEPPSEGKNTKNIFQIHIKNAKKRIKEISFKILYLAHTKEISTNEKDSLVAKIINLYDENEKAISDFILSNNICNELQFIKKLENKGYFEDSIREDIDKFIFEINLEKAISNTLKEYRDKCPIKHKFSYVGAEIEYFVKYLTNYYIFTSISKIDDEIDNFIKKNVPIQISMSVGIDAMRKDTADFRKV